MSLVNGAAGLYVYLNDGNPSGEPPGVTLQVRQDLELVDSGNNIHLLTSPIIGCSYSSLTVGGRQYLGGLDHGLRKQYSYLLSPSNPATLSLSVLPTEQGSSANGVNQFVCSSNNYVRGKSANSRYSFRRTNPANWFRPGNIDTPPYSVNTSLLSNAITDVETDLGLPGHDFIIREKLTVNIPDDVLTPTFRYAILNVSSFVAPNTFSVFETLNLNTGVLTPAIGTTNAHPYVMSKPDNSDSVINYIALPDLGLGYFVGTPIVSGTYSEVYASAIIDFGPGMMTPGPLSIYSYTCIGAKAQSVADCLWLYSTVG